MFKSWGRARIQATFGLNSETAPSHIWAARQKGQPALLQTGSHPAGSLPKLQTAPKQGAKLIVMCNVKFDHEWVDEE